MKNPFEKIILFLSIIIMAGCQSQEKRLDEAMQKSISWLWAQQGEDGGWHSQTHAVLKDGKALTPYILYHLMLISDEQFKKSDNAVEKGAEFIRREIKSSMSMSKDSLPLLNYPNYSAAYALRVLCFLKKDTALQQMIADHLLREQFVEHRGITPDHLAYGGWGYGEPGLPYGEHGHVDVSHTRRIVEALMEAKERDVRCQMPDARLVVKGVEPYQIQDAKFNPLATHDSHTSFGCRSHHRMPKHFCEGIFCEGNSRSHDLTISQKDAKEAHTPDTLLLRSYALTLLRSVSFFLEGVQRSRNDLRLYEGCTSRKKLPYDGGFISSAVTLATNKSQPVFIDGAGYHYPSYATATCDGLLALLALGMQESQAYKDAVSWLRTNQHMNTIDGLSKVDPEQWHQVMHYYHYAVRTEAMAAAGISGPWSKELRRLLIKEQQTEGYYINPIGGVNKEDDPLMATIFAVQAGCKLFPPTPAL